MKNENGKMKIEKMNRWQGLSKPRILLALLSCLFLAVGLLSCADENGLHDQNALMVTFEITGLGDSVSGTYRITGDYDSWGMTSDTFSLSKGEGTSPKIAVASSNIVFTICDSDWNRGWYPTLEGNSYDGGDAKWHNFYINDLDLNAGEATIVIDSSNLDANNRIAPKLK